MRILLNGEQRDIPDHLKMADLIELLELADQRVAVEVNEALVPRSSFEQHQLNPNDQVEIIHAVGGG